MDIHMLSLTTAVEETAKHYYYHCGSCRHLPRTRTTIPMLAHLKLCLLLSISLALFSMTQAARVCTVSDVSNASQCASGESFYNNTMNCCQRCSTCPDRYEVRTPCSTTSDTYCVPTCAHEALTWNENERSCVINCGFCSYQCDAVKRQCICDPSICYHPSDLYCQTAIPCNPMTSSRPTVSNGNTGNPSSLPPWGVGLIAVGAVLGIVAFSAGFLLMGICTRKSRTAGIESGGSDNSESVLMSNGRSSRGTHSTYISGYPNQSLLDLLRNTNTPVHSSSSSIHSSPRSGRASPCPVRTLQVKPDNNNSNSNFV